MKIPRPIWSPLMKLSVIIILFASAVYALYKFRGGVVPVILAALLAYIMSGVVNWLHRKLRINRGIVILVAYLFLLIIIGAFFFFVFPMLFRQVRHLNLNLQEMIFSIRATVGKQWDVFGVIIDGKRILDNFSGSLQDLISPIFGRSLDMIGQLLTSIVWVIFIIVCSIYIVKDGQAIGRWFGGLPPPDYREDYERISSDIRTIWSAFFRGQLLLALIVMVILTGVGMAIGLPNAMLMGFLGGMLEFFPSLGHGAWLVLAIIIALVRGSDWMPVPHWTFAFILVGVTAIFDQFDNNYLVPRIIGRSVRLPALVVILGIVIGASFAGVLGVALAAPSVASLRVIGRYIYARLIDIDPFPAEQVYTVPLPPPVLWWWQKRRPQEPPGAPAPISGQVLKDDQDYKIGS